MIKDYKYNFLNKMKNNEITQKDDKKPNKFYRTLNINKKINPKYKSKSNKRLDIKLTKPIKIKNLNNIKANFQQNTLKTQNKTVTQEREIDASIEDFRDKDVIPSINSNKNNPKINSNILKNQYIKINHKSHNRTIKNIKTQIISNDTNSFSNIRNHNQLINGGNNKNIHGKLNLNITLNNKSPVRLRKINSNKKSTYDLDCSSTNKKDKQINSIFIYNKKKMNTDLYMDIFNGDELSKINNTLSNEESIITNLQKEIENVKKDNLYKEKLIYEMKKQLENIKNEQLKKRSNGTNLSPLKDEVLLLKNEMASLYNKNINKDAYNKFINNKINETFNNDDEFVLFDKLKINFSNNNILIDELLNENKQIKRKINDKSIVNGNQKNYYSYLLYLNKKEISINYLTDINTKKLELNNIDNFNCFDMEDMEDRDNNNINNYVEKSLKKLNKKNFDIKIDNEYDNNEQKNNTKLMIKMTLISNYIPEEDVISLFMNNLLNYEYSIELFITKYMKTNDNLDKEIVHNYFKSICFDKNNKFNINNIFIEINSFYDKDIQKLREIQISKFFSEKKNILNKIIKECKSIDSANNGLIEVNKFKNILNKINFFKEFNEDETKIFHILLYNMKKNANIKQIGLYHLSYYNLIEDLGLNDCLLKDNISENNSSMVIERNDVDKKNSLFFKSSNEKDNEEKKNEENENKNEKKIHKRIISNVDFTGDNNKKDRLSGNSNYTYGLLSSNKYSFDYSSKSGSKETSSLKEGIKELTSKFMDNEEYLIMFCKEYVDNLFNACMEDVKRKKILLNNDDFNV